MSKKSVISLISYDAEYLPASIKTYYNYVDEIVLGLDENRTSWSGNQFSFDEEALKQDVSRETSETLEELDDLESVSASDVPKPKRKRRTVYKGKRQRQIKKDKSGQNHKKKKGPRKKKHVHNQNKIHTQKRRYPRSGRVFSEEFDIEEEGTNTNTNVSDENIEDQKFNTEKHHKQQHKF